MDAERQVDLSPGQLLIWLGMQRHPDAPIYNAVTTFRIAGELDHAAFETAFRSLLNESDALRSTFVDVDGVPRCVVRVPPDEPVVAHIDLSTDADPDAACDAWIAASSGRVLPIEQQTFDTALLRVRPGETIWYLNQHHLIADAWSTRLVFEQVAERYADVTGHAERKNVPLPSFGGWVDQLGQGAASVRLDRARQYWDRKADQATSCEPLSFFGLAHDSRSPAADRQSVALGPVRPERIRRLLTDRSLAALNDDVTLFQVFATVLFAFLYRATGQSKLSIGAPMLNRATATERRTVGLMMEMLLLCVEIDDAETLSTLYAKVRDETINFLRNGCAGASNARLVRTFSVMLNFVRGSYPEFDGMPTAVDYVHAGAAEPHNALRVQVQDFAGHGDFCLDFDFNAGTFPAPSRLIVVQQFLQLVDCFIDQRDTPIANLDLLPPDERRRLLVDLNQTAAPYQKALPLHMLIERHAESAPGRLAVTDAIGAIDYRELERRSNRLARELIAKGVTRGQRVGLLLDAGVDFSVAALATMKAGAAYMPIDTDAPEARRALLLESGEPAAVIATGDVPLPGNVPVIRLDTDSSSLAGRPPTRPDIDITIDDDAYVIFTSGSTGSPKGVICTHRGVLNLLNDVDARQPLRAGAACSLWTSINFDVSVYELFSALCYGGTLHFVPHPIRTDIAGLYDWCCEKKIEGAYLPPFMLDDFVAMSEAGPKRLALKRLLVGVEPIPLRTLQALAGANPGLTIVNGYGPTETTICATLYTVPATPDDDRRTPIGRPVQNNRVYVLDELGQPVPHGLPGELYVGGDGVARGYLGSEALTAERFINDPFDTDSRLYRTGDRVRYRHDDNLEFIGRVDHQIKIRGHRIEPAEIERRLVEHPDVREALVMSRRAGDSGPGLVAYLISDEPLTLSAGDWRSLLEPSLPGYMIPSAYVSLRAFPQTPGGKIDRSALPDAEVVETAFMPPETPLQIRIAAIWSEILGRDRIGIDDHFIDIGGDSIQALQIAARAHDAGIRFSARDIFEHATVAVLAAHADELDDVRGRRDAAPDNLHDAASRAGVSASDLDDILAEFGDG